MRDNKITTVNNDNDKNVQKDDIPKQTSLDTTIDMHAHENEEKDVRRSVLHTEDELKARRQESKADEQDRPPLKITIYDKDYVVCYNQAPQGQGWYQGSPPPQQGQGWFQGPPQQQPPPQQGWFQGPPPQQGNYQYPQPPAYDSRFGHTHPRHSNYHSSPPLDYSENNPDRNAFVRKVMTLLMVMLLVTIFVMILVLALPPARDFFRRFGLAIALPCMIMLLVMSCFMPTSACARKPPTNYICLAIVVVIETLLCCAISAQYRTILILQAFLATMVVVAFCVLLAFSSFDFTKLILIVYCVGLALFAIMVLMMVAHFVFGFRSKILWLVVTVAVTLLNVVMLVIELQMVLGGKAVEIGEEDYALGAYMLYTSIIHLFINLLHIMGLAESL